MGSGYDFYIDGEFESARIKYYFNSEECQTEGFNPVVYYYNENAKNLAYSVQKSLVRATNFKDDGVSVMPFPILQITSPASIMVECGYIIHPYERAKLSDKEFQKTVAEGIANGVENHLKNVRNHHYKRLKNTRHNKSL